ncbi:MAG: hypothetical protein ACLQGP_11420 [Isosphaeraceae bacterium]
MRRLFLSEQEADGLPEIAVSSSRPAEKGTISGTLGFVVRTVTSEAEARSLSCPDCRLLLNLIQPDEIEPSRLLGTCDGCSKWFYLVEIEPDWKSCLMIDLPNGDVLQQTLAKGDVPKKGKDVTEA